MLSSATPERPRNTQEAQDCLDAPASPGRNGWSGLRVELVVALLLTAIVIGFHAIRAISAGALWRDEAGAVQLATLPSFKETARYFHHEAFPLLFPATVRGVNWLFDGSDAGFRVFGMIVGISIVGVLWFNLWVFRRGVPLLSLVLLGLSGPFIQWGDSVRGYGLGTLVLLLTVGLVWRLLGQLTLARWATAALGAVATVQCLFHAPVLLLATCLGGAAVSLRRRDFKLTLAILSVSVVGIASLLPYLGVLQRGRDWDVLVRAAVSLPWLAQKLSATLSASGGSSSWIWLSLLLVSLVICVVGQCHQPSSSAQSARQELFLFCGVALVCSVSGQILFLKLLSYPTHDWYYVALMGYVALFMDIVLGSVQSARRVRVGNMVLVLVMAAAAAPATWSQVRVRQTNVDLVASSLKGWVEKEDVVVVTPWYNGISFGRYYQGRARWMTVPPVTAHAFHRFDLVKEELRRSNPEDCIQPVLASISSALKTGHRVWVVGSLQAPVVDESLASLPEARGGEWRIKLGARSLAWGRKVASHLQAMAVHVEDVSTGFDGPVSRLEDLPVHRFDGLASP